MRTTTLVSRSVIAEDRQPGASANDSAPSGLVVVIENKPDRPLNLRALDNPSISGVALQIHWADIEPTEENPDWTKLDGLFAAAVFVVSFWAHAHDYRLNLRS